MLEYWLWLAHRPNLNDHQKLQLVQSFQTPQGVYQAEPGDFDAFPTITGQGKIALAEKDLSPYQKVLEYCQREQIRILTIFDPAYPRRLFNIYDPPPVLYYKGTLPQFDGVPVVSVVGTRRSTAYGQATAMRLGLEISQCGGGDCRFPRGCRAVHSDAGRGRGVFEESVKFQKQEDSPPR